MSAMTTIRVRFEYEIRNRVENCEVRDFVDCETRDELEDRLLEIADESASWSVVPAHEDVAALWAAIEAARETT